MAIDWTTSFLIDASVPASTFAAGVIGLTESGRVWEGHFGIQMSLDAENLKGRIYPFAVPEGTVLEVKKVDGVVVEAYQYGRTWFRKEELHYFQVTEEAMAIEMNDRAKLDMALRKHGLKGRSLERWYRKSQFVQTIYLRDDGRPIGNTIEKATRRKWDFFGTGPNRFRRPSNWNHIAVGLVAVLVLSGIDMALVLPLTGRTTMGHLFSACGLEEQGRGVMGIATGALFSGLAGGWLGMVPWGMMMAGAMIVEITRSERKSPA